MSVCMQAWDGEHEWEQVTTETNPDYPDDEDADLVIWECALCGRRTRTESWQGYPGL